jgi:hypothetical protein
MPYKYTLWNGKGEAVIEVIIDSPNLDHAKFVTRNLHMDFYSNSYIPFGSGMQNSRSQLVHVPDRPAKE